MTELSAKKMALPRYNDKPEDWGSFKKEFLSAVRQTGMGLSLLLQHAERTFTEADSLATALKSLKKDNVLQDKTLLKAYETWEIESKKIPWELIQLHDCLVLAMAHAPHSKTILGDGIEDDNGAMVWAVLIDEYQSRTFGRFSLLRQELRELKMKPDRPMEYFRKMDRLRVQIQDAANTKDYKLHDLDMLEIAFRALPSELDKIRTEMHKGKDLTLTWLKEATTAAASAIQTAPTTEHAYYGGGDSGQRRSYGRNNRHRHRDREGRPPKPKLVCTNSRCKHLSNHVFKDCFNRGGPMYNKKSRSDDRGWRRRARGPKQAHAMLAHYEDDSDSDYDMDSFALLAHWSDSDGASDWSDSDGGVPGLVDTDSSSSDWSDYESDWGKVPVADDANESGRASRTYTGGVCVGHDENGSMDSCSLAQPAASTKPCQSLPLPASSVCQPDSLTHTPQSVTTALHVLDGNDAGAPMSPWIVDSGCSAHMTTTADDVQEAKCPLRPFKPVEGIGGTSVAPTASGLATIHADGVPVKLDALVVPGLNKRLFSVGQYLEDNPQDTIHFYRDGGHIDCADSKKIRFVKKGRMYYIGDLELGHQAKVATQRQKDLVDWHRRLGHINMELTKKLVLKHSLANVKGVTTGRCHPCDQAKSTRKSIPKTKESTATRPM